MKKSKGDSVSTKKKEEVVVTDRVKQSRFEQAWFAIITIALMVATYLLVFQPNLIIKVVGVTLGLQASVNFGKKFFNS